MSTYNELKEKIAKLQEEADNLQKKEKQEAIASIKTQMKAKGITVKDLGSSTKDVQAKSAIPAKFRHPETGQTWNGRGRKPAWMNNHDDAYLIK